MSILTGPALRRGDRWRGGRPVIALVVLGFALALAAPKPARAQVDPVDCVGPAADAEPGTPEWEARDIQNVICAERRLVDAAAHPVAVLPLEMPVSDPYRDPSLHDGTRFRYFATTVTNRDGQELAVELYRPCAAGECTDQPDGLRIFEAPYPAVLVQHGGYQSRKELHRWATQSLAEAGYLTVALDAIHADDTFFEDSTDVLDWLTATPDDPTAAGEHNPFWAELDRDHIGVAGHSGGGATANRLGSEDPRISAVVAWDRSGRYDLPESITVPSLYMIADHGFTPERHADQPDPDGYEEGEHDPGDKWQDFDRARAQEIDAMKLVLRAATHLDWVPMVAASSQYGEAVSAYYTVAWFDRYLRGAHDPAVARGAFERLIADRFDDSYDRHNISQGVYDPAQQMASGDVYGGNVPYLLEELPVADRLSFYYDSKCFLTSPISGERISSNDLREQACRAATAAPPPDGAGGSAPSSGDVLPATGDGAVGLASVLLLAAGWASRQRRWSRS